MNRWWRARPEVSFGARATGPSGWRLLSCLALLGVVLQLLLVGLALQRSLRVVDHRLYLRPAPVYRGDVPQHTVEPTLEPHGPQHHDRLP